MARTDHLVRCITADGCITAMAVDSTETVQTAQALHISRSYVSRLEKRALEYLRGRWPAE